MIYKLILIPLNKQNKLSHIHLFLGGFAKVCFGYIQVRAHAINPPHKWHIWFFPTHKPTLKKPKEPFFANARTDIATIIQTVFILKNEIDKILNLSLRTHFKIT